MRKVFLFMMVSVDGFFEGPNHDLSWHNVDDEFNKYAIAQTDKVDTLLFGRRTYELMAKYWPTENARKTDPIVAEQMNTKPKIVFSKSLKKLEPIPYWENARLVGGSVFEEIRKLKKQKGQDLAIYGSNNLTVSLIEKNLVDEFRLMINPVVIGRGTPLFYGLNGKFSLKLVKLGQFKSGNVLLYYHPLK